MLRLTKLRICSVNPSRLYTSVQNSAGFNYLASEFSYVAHKMRLAQFEQTTQVQQLAIPHLLQNQSVVLTGPSGSGKTLAYLVPLMLQILRAKFLENKLEYRLYQRDDIAKGKDFNEMYFTLKAKELHSKNLKARREYRQSPFYERKVYSPRAIILTSGRELAAQIYKEARLLEPEGLIALNRVGSALQVFCPIAPHVTGDASRKEKKLEESEQNIISVKNVVNNASWKLCDVMITTPKLLGAVLSDRDSYEPEVLCPSVIICDEFDLLMENPSTASLFKKIMKRYGTGAESFAEMGSFFGGAKMNQQDQITEQLLSKERQVNSKSDQFVFVSSSLPGRDEPSQQLRVLQEWIGKDLKKIIAPGSFKTSESLTHQVIGPDMDDGLLFKELNKVVSKAITSKEQMLIFVQNRDEAESLKQKLEQKHHDQIESFTSFNTASSRIEVLENFKNGRIPVLIATSLAQRGFEFPKLKTVVQWHFAKSEVDYINRLGRVGRRGASGHAVSFIRNEDLELFSKIRQLEEKGKGLQEAPLL